MKELEDGRIPRKAPHSVVINNREKAVITGIDDIDSFNEFEIIVLTSAGFMTVVGSDLHIASLNLQDGQLVVEGVIQSIDYSDHEEERQKTSIFSKVFK